MANNVGTLVIAPIRPASDQDAFPTALANEVQGGLHCVTTLAERNAIPTLRRVAGMKCWVENEQTTYRLEADLTTWVVDSGGGTGPTVTKVTFGEAFATNECFRLEEGVALKVTSLDASAPWIDGITLESGVAGSDYAVALLSQQLYTTPLALPAAPNRVLFLGQDGKLTATVPSKAASDLWLVRAARRNDNTHFVFSPSTPIQLA